MYLNDDDGDAKVAGVCILEVSICVVATGAAPVIGTRISRDEMS